MTASRDPERLIRAFLDEGPTDLPDRTYDAVRSHIDGTRQRVVIGPWREPRMSNFGRFAIAAAAVLVVAVAGYNLFPGFGGPGGPGPSPSPTATPAPTPAPTPTPTPAPTGPIRLPSTGELEPGTYFIADRSITQASRLILTVPAGWTATADTFLYKNAEQPDELMLSTWVVTHIFDDACRWDDGSLVDAGGTVEELVSALANQKGREASLPSAVTFAGFPAQRIELTVPATLDTATCTNGNLRYWPDPGPDLGGGFCCNAAGNTDVVYAVDIAGKRLVVVARHYPGSSEQDKAELQAILDSIQIEP